MDAFAGPSQKTENGRPPTLRTNPSTTTRNRAPSTSTSRASGTWSRTRSSSKRSTSCRQSWRWSSTRSTTRTDTRARTAWPRTKTWSAARCAVQTPTSRQRASMEAASRRTERTGDAAVPGAAGQPRTARRHTVRIMDSRHACQNWSYRAFFSFLFFFFYLCVILWRIAGRKEASKPELIRRAGNTTSKKRKEIST